MMTIVMMYFGQAFKKQLVSDNVDRWRILKHGSAFTSTFKAK